MPTTEEQELRYADYSKQAASLLAQAKRRPLTRKEFERLQMLLACMRMICDTPAILDPTCRVLAFRSQSSPIYHRGLHAACEPICLKASRSRRFLFLQRSPYRSPGA